MTISPKSPSYLVVGLAFFGFILIGLVGGAAGVLLPSQILDYHVDKTIIGLLFFTFSAGYFLAASSAGYLTQKFGQPWYLTIGAIAFLASSLAFGLRPTFILLLALNGVLGFGSASIDAGFNAMIAALPRSTSLLNSLHGFYGAGALLGPLVASAFLAMHWPWYTVYLVWGVLSLPLLIGCLALVRVAKVQTSEQATKPHSDGNITAATLRLAPVWLGALFLLLYVGLEISVGNWSYSFLLEDRHLGTLLAGWVVSGYWLGLTLGRFLVHLVVRWLRVGSRTMIYGCLIGIVLSLALVWFLPGTLIAALSFCLIGFFLGPIFPTTIAVVPEGIPGPLAASAIGFFVASSVVGGAFFAWLAGTLAQSFGIWILLPGVLVLTVLMWPNWWAFTHQLAARHTS